MKERIFSCAEGRAVSRRLLTVLLALLLMLSCVSSAFLSVHAAPQPAGIFGVDPGDFYFYGWDSEQYRENPFGTASKFTTFVFGNVTNVVHSEGSIAVGGNYNNTSDMSLATNIQGNNASGNPHISNDDVIVVVRGTSSSGGNGSIEKGKYATVTGHTYASVIPADSVVYYTQSEMDNFFNNAEATLKNASKTFESLDDKGVAAAVTNASQNNGRDVVTVTLSKAPDFDSNGLNVVTIDLNSIYNNDQKIDFSTDTALLDINYDNELKTIFQTDTPGKARLIVNVIDSGVTRDSDGTAARTLNFYSNILGVQPLKMLSSNENMDIIPYAALLNICGMRNVTTGSLGSTASFRSAVLAPWSDLTASHGHIDGNSVWKSITCADDVGFEVHAHPFVTDVPVPVPEPGTTVVINKLDPSGNRLANASLELYDGGTRVCGWTSSNSEGYSVRLTPGSQYTLRELSAPSGYLKSDDVTFTVNPDGYTQTVNMTDYPIVLGVEKTVTSTAEGYKPGDVISYSIKVTNNSQRTVGDISVADSLSGSWGTMPASTVNGRPVTVTPNGSSMRVSALEAGDSVLLPYSYTVAKNDYASSDLNTHMLTNTATAAANGSSSTDTADAPLAPGFTVTKQVKKDGGDYADSVTAEPGDTVYFKITVQNTSESAVTINEISEVFRCNNAETALPEAWETTLGGFTFPRDIASGESLVIELPAYTIPNTPQGGQYSNSFTAQDIGDTATVEVNPTPSLALTKTLVGTAPEGGYLPGGRPEFKIVLTNNGNCDLTNITLDEKLSGGSFGTLPETTASGAAVSITPNGTSRLVINKLDEGDSITLRYTYTVGANDYTASAAADHEMTNTVTARSDDTPEAEASETFPLGNPTYDLEVKKEVRLQRDGQASEEGWTDGRIIVKAGDTVEFRLSVRNNGSMPLEGLTYSDLLTLPNGTEKSTVAGSSEVSADWRSAIEALPSTLQPGSDSTKTVSLNIPADALADQCFDNSFRAVYDGSTYSDGASVEVAPEPSLEITKTALAASYAPGETASYTISVRNTGNCVLRDIAITDSRDVIYNGTSFAAGSVICTIPSLAPNADASIVVQMPISLNASSDTITNSAAAVSPKTPEMVTASDSASSDINVTSEPKVTVTKTASINHGRPGDKVAFTITVKNSTDTNITGLYLYDDLVDYAWHINNLPAGQSVSFVTLDSPLTSTEDVTVMRPASSSTDVLNWTIPAGSLGGTVTTNTAYLFTEDDFDENDIDTDKAFAEDSVDVTTDDVTSLIVQKSANVSSAEPGDELSYTVFVTNKSNIPQENIVVHELLPGGSWVYDTSDPNLMLSGSDLVIKSLGVNGISPTLSYVYTIPESFLSGADLSSASSDRNLLNKVTASNDTVSGSDSASVAVYQPGIEVKKTVNVSQADIDDTLTYTIVVTNTGETALTSVKVVDSRDVTYNNKVVSAGDILATIPSLAVGASRTYTVTCTVPANVSDGDIIYNTATATASNGATDKDTAQTEVDDSGKALYDLAVVKTADVETVKTGDSVSYTVTVTNTGRRTLTGIVLTDSLPVTFNGRAYSANETLTTISTLAPGATKTFRLTYSGTSSLTANTTLTNTVTATPAETGATKGTAEVTVKEKDNPSYKVTKTANNTSVSPGEKLEYSVTVTNTGNCVLHDITVADAQLNWEYRIATLDVGKSWTSPSGGLSFTVPTNATVGSKISNTAVVNGDVLGAQSSVLAVSVDSGDLITPDTGDTQEESSTALILLITLLSLLVCGSAGYLIYRFRFAGRSLRSIFRSAR